jgi:anti-sigma B factor antagonist
MQIVERTAGDVTILDLSGRLVLGDGDEALRDTINRLVEEGRRKVVLNMLEISYLDSAGLGTLVSKYITLHNRGGQLRVCNLQRRAFAVLEVTKLLGVLQAFASEREALRSLAETDDRLGFPTAT